MTKVDGYNNRYELVNVKGKVSVNYVATYKNNDKKTIFPVHKDDWSEYKVVADSDVKQEGFDL